MKKLIIAVLLVAVMAVPALASVQNVKVSGDITSTSILRYDFGFGNKDAGGITQAKKQNTFISQTRVSAEADLTDNVSTMFRLLNERAWGRIASTDTQVDVDLAYVELREMIYSPLTVTLGRQELYYGNGFIMGGGPNNTASGNIDIIAKDLTLSAAVDAVKLVFNYDPLTIDMFAAILDAPSTGFVEKYDSFNLYGINANYKFSDPWNTAAEAYFFATIDRTNISTLPSKKVDKIYVPGVRLSTDPMRGLNLQGELACQGGTDEWTSGSAKRAAMGGQFIASYILPFEKTAKYEPVVAYAYTYVSGDKDVDMATDNPGDRQKAWDPMFEDMAGGKIYNAIFDLTNMHVNEFSFSASPAKDLIAKLTWTILSLDKKLNSTSWTRTLPDNSSVDYAVNTDKKGLGNEIDLDLIYAYSEDVELALSAGWFMPGNVFTSANEKTATQLLTSISVAF